ncbi:hypothetical protein [Paenibacillus sp. sgz5001063]|uniref:hypothetical protein n=1 Tax=Paenibacillus sp. sgz5001063 TaxID=3242474 RepID=UPI0036D36F8C
MKSDEDAAEPSFIFLINLWKSMLVRVLSGICINYYAENAMKRQLARNPAECATIRLSEPPNGWKSCKCAILEYRLETEN